MSGGPGRGGCDGVILGLVARLVAGAAPRLGDELVHDVGDAGAGGVVRQVTGGVALPHAVNVQVERVETSAVGHHRVQDTESFALLQMKALDKMKTT